MDQQQLNPCACGCGAMVPGKWKRGHSRRAQASGVKLAPLPKDSELDDLPPEVFGDIVDVDEQPTHHPAAGPLPETPPGGPAPEPGDDEPPKHAARDWQAKARRPRKAAEPKRITAAIRGDIDAKISFALEIPGRIWQARDPVCGGVFVEQRPEIAGALTEIVCQSPDLVQWFAGGGGQFMLWLNVMAAAWPVVTVVMAHHVYHSIEAAPEEAESPYRQYAA